MDSLGYDDGLALGSIGLGGGLLFWQRAAVGDRMDGTTALIFGAGFAVLGGLSWFLCKGARSYLNKKKD